VGGPVKVGVVGIGFGQQVHVPAFRRNKECEVTAICATTYERARAVADRLGVPKAHGRWQDLVSDPEVNVVAVATPPAIQPVIALAALEQGKPVFCEKPLATNRERTAEMLEKAKRSGIAHMVDFEFVVIDEWLQAKQLLGVGALGQLRHVSVNWHVEAYAHRKNLKSWKTGTAAIGGGVLNAAVSHTFHYLEWLLGPICKLRATLSTPRGQDGLAGEAVAILTLELAKGVLVSISVSNCAFMGTGHRLEIYGDDGCLLLENPTSDYAAGFQLRHATRESGRFHSIGGIRGEATIPDGRVVAVGKLVDRFINWVQTGTPAVPSFQEGHRNQCLVDWAREAHRTGQWIDVSVF